VRGMMIGGEERKGDKRKREEEWEWESEFLRLSALCCK